jgi:hypothetical protein
VLPDGFHRIRHYGLFANGHRAAKIERCRALLNVPSVETEVRGGHFGNQADYLFNFANVFSATNQDVAMVAVISSPHQLLLLFRFRSCPITADRRPMQPKLNTKMTARDFSAATKD